MSNLINKFNERPSSRKSWYNLSASYKQKLIRRHNKYLVNSSSNEDTSVSISSIVDPFTDDNNCLRTDNMTGSFLSKDNESTCQLSSLVKKNEELLKKYSQIKYCKDSNVNQAMNCNDNDSHLHIVDEGQAVSVHRHPSTYNLYHLQSTNSNLDVSGEIGEALISSTPAVTDDLKSNEDRQICTARDSSYYQLTTKSYSDDTFKTTLGKCLVTNKVNHTQCNALLEVLRTHPNLEFLPKDARSLLYTPRVKISVKQIVPGEYIHLGLEFCIQASLQKIQDDLIPKILIIDFSTDGAEINKTTQIWPIQCRVANVPKSKPEIAGAYVGRAKAENAEDLFKDFVTEFNLIVKKGGVKFKNKFIPITLRCFIADAPARAYVLNHVNHIGEFPCSQCKVRGVRHEGSMRFSGVGHQLRTSKEYRECSDKKHHKGQSALHDLPFDPVTQVPMEYMHLICLGNMKKIIEATVGGKYRVPKLTAYLTRFLSNRLVLLQSFCPKDFARIPREIEEYIHYKATEFRQILLYTFPVVALGIISEEQYSHFLLLHSAMRILLDSSSTTQKLDFAEDALQRYVIDSERIYGLKFNSFNVHAVLHLVADYIRFGSCESTSAFPYENNMSIFKDVTRKNNQTLQQIYKRQLEIKYFENFQVSCNVSERLLKATKIHSSGPIIDKWKNKCQQFEDLVTPKYYYSIQNHENTCILTDNTICIIKNIVCIENNYFLIVQKFTLIEPLYNILGEPSTEFGVHLCKKLDHTLFPISYDSIKSKCYRMPVWRSKKLLKKSTDEILNDTYVVISML